MKKTAFLSIMGALALSACSDKEENGNDDLLIEGEGVKIELTQANLANWSAYTQQVARLLEADTEKLLKEWENSYADIFKQHNNDAYPSAISCIEEIIAGCTEIASEVGEQKIGSPRQLYLEGNKTEALFAVESWYSWHSRDDYSNNILSIRNALYNSRSVEVNAHSIMALLRTLNLDLATELDNKVEAAYRAILNIPQPLRNNLAADETSNAVTTCGDLEDLLTAKVSPLLLALPSSYDEELDLIVANFVDRVVLPTYSDLVDSTRALRETVDILVAQPSNRNIKTACQAWLNAREPWEKSEAFLFGPVAMLSIDPNIDSWPLDSDAIVNHLNSGNLSDLIWSDGQDEDLIEAAQNVRGFHTLEFLLFVNGQPRTLN